MTIDEAIKTLDRYFILNLGVPYSEVLEASKMGIEALKREKAYRHPTVFDAQSLLPGETEE